MDSETERRLAALIMEEASRLRLQADQEGVHVYLAKPSVRGRPNPQFLKATVRGIEQANRAAEISDMWRRRALELELEERKKERRRHRYHDKSSSHSHHGTVDQHKDSHTSKWPGSHGASSSAKLHSQNATDRAYEHDSDDSCAIKEDLHDDGLKEDEVDDFLHSRVKRGRGAIGSRMDETGPYPFPQPGRQCFPEVRDKEDWEDRVIGPVAGPSFEFDKHVQEFRRVHKKRKVKHKGEDLEDSNDGHFGLDDKKRKVKHKREGLEDFKDDNFGADLKQKRKRKSKKKHKSSHSESKRTKRREH